MYNPKNNFVSGGYNLSIKTRVVNKRTNLGKIYFENTYIIIISKIKAKIIWFK